MDATAENFPNVVDVSSKNFLIHCLASSSSSASSPTSLTSTSSLLV